MSDEPFEQALLSLPRNLRASFDLFPRESRESAEEIRLRAGFPVSVLLPDGESPVSRTPVTTRDLAAVLEIATQGSAYAVSESVRNGFLTVRGGHRIGLCGEAVMKGGQISGFREISSLSIRVARERRGAADALLSELVSEGRPLSALIAAPPGAGKTTLLRDVIRRFSEGFEGLAPQRVGVADERGELAAMFHGVAQLDVGPSTDVLSGAPKAEAMLMLLRCMNPQLVAADEITAPEDARALMQCANCGVKLLATAHADSMDDLKSRPLYAELLSRGIFLRFVFIENNMGKRSMTVC